MLDYLLVALCVSLLAAAAVHYAGKTSANEYREAARAVVDGPALIAGAPPDGDESGGGGEAG